MARYKYDINGHPIAVWVTLPFEQWIPLRTGRPTLGRHRKGGLRADGSVSAEDNALITEEQKLCGFDDKHLSAAGDDDFFYPSEEDAYLYYPEDSEESTDDNSSQQDETPQAQDAGQQQGYYEPPMQQGYQSTEMYQQPQQGSYPAPDYYQQPQGGQPGQIAGYDSYGNPVDSYGNPIQQQGGYPQPVGYDSYGNPVPQDNVNPAPPVDGGVYPAEGSPLLYISPRVSGGVVTDMNKIEARIKVGVFTDGDIVLLTHPGYAPDYYVVNGKWDAPDGGGTAFLDIPYNDETGERNVAPYQANPVDHRSGTIEVVGTINDYTGIDGYRNADNRYAWRTKDGHSTWKQSPQPTHPFSGIEADDFEYADADNDNFYLGATGDADCNEGIFLNEDSDFLSAIGTKETPAQKRKRLLKEKLAGEQYRPLGKTPVKAPVKPISKIPTKLPVKPIGKIPTKLPVKPIGKVPTKLPVKPIGKTPVKVPTKPIGKKPATGYKPAGRYFTKAEASKRKQNKATGQSKGLKGNALRSFIRKK